MNKIYLELRSGLGNQLFQFSFGYSLANGFNKELVLCPSYFDSSWKFLLKKLLGREARTFRLPLLVSRPFKVMPPNYWKELLNGSASVQIMDETKVDASTVRKICAEPNDVYLRGYWQDEKYFSTYRDDLTEIFQPKFDLSETYKATLNTLKSNVVGLHVRRGDFLTNKAFGACTIDYYLAAIREVQNTISDPAFLVFTNNKAWVKTNFPESISYKIYPSDNVNSDVEEMFLMSKMKSLIISNSTFSWWSAYLNRVPDNLIICPQRWYLSPRLETRTPGLISNGWKKINNSLELVR